LKTAGKDRAPERRSPPPDGTTSPFQGQEEEHAFINWKFFGLREPPFSSFLDTQFFFLGRRQEAEVSRLIFGISQRRGIMVLTGAAGTGKTLVGRTLREQLDYNVHGLVVSASVIGDANLVKTVAGDFGIAGKGGGNDGEPGALQELHGLFLEKLREGQNVVIFIDEAHLLTEGQLEQVRLLGDAGEDGEKAVQIILAGRPSLAEKLMRLSLRRLSRSITVRAELQSFTRSETEEFVRHRLKVAGGGTSLEIFSPAALWAVHFWSRGNPRQINVLCGRAVTGAFAVRSKTVGLRVLRRAKRELALEPRILQPSLAAAGMAAAAVLLFAVMAWMPMAGRTTSDVKPESPALNSKAPPAVLSSPGLEGRREPDGVKIARVTSSEDSLKASLTTLFRLWGIDALADESLTWKIVNFKPAFLDIFFKETGLFRQYGIELHPLEAGLPFLRTAGLPCLFTYGAAGGKDREGRHAVLAGFTGGRAVVYDPMDGRVEVPEGQWEEERSGPVYYLYRAGSGFAALSSGSRGAKVVSLQEELRKAGLYGGGADGHYGEGTRRAVVTLQDKYGLDPVGVAGLRTRLVLLKEAGRFSRPPL
jgi:general secretion pathway protein A